MASANEEVKKDFSGLNVTVKTVRNGYLLLVGDEGYMYFNVQSLLEGFCIRLGLERLETMTNGEIRALLQATKDGSIAKKLQAEVTELKAIVTEQKKLIREQKREIKQLKCELNHED
ncbi:MAG: hypothetical protein IK067_04740 [Prevotella sp.]|nr:hypothetical protein [Prevotella sp.]